jgi:transposase
MSSQYDKKRSKADSLIEEGTLNASSERVNDPKFREGEFFDPRDIVQVKYEMLRRVRVENATVTDAAEEYGFSRPAYYQAAVNYDKAGIAGLVPRKRGPRGPHKIHPDILTFLEQQVIPGQPIRARKLAKLVLQEFGLDIHPRTIERALSGKKTLK